MCLITCFILILDTSINAHAQDYQPDKELSGVWFFKQAEFTTYRHGDINPLEVEVVDKAEDLSNAGFPFEIVFRKVEMSGGQILCTLGEKPDDKQDKLYLLKDGILEPITSMEKENTQQKNTEQYAATPLNYTYEVKGNELIFTIKYSFGNSRYNFPLEGKMLITLSKQYE